ncbi:hypothetical protein [Kitasatospora cinereorecta]|uniref:Uncharacterized protein n=1 Tax=Kitasatospora cinereorecta TaxID=285560 RepID=A0ABW0V8K3_9ACTN
MTREEFERTVPEQRWYDLRIIEVITSAVDHAAAAIGAAFAEELESKRNAYIEAAE